MTEEEGLARGGTGAAGRLSPFLVFPDTYGGRLTVGFRHRKSVACLGRGALLLGPPFTVESELRKQDVGYFTTNQVARYARLSEKSVRMAADSGALKCIRADI